MYAVQERRPHEHLHPTVLRDRAVASRKLERTAEFESAITGLQPAVLNHLTTFAFGMAEAIRSECFEPSSTDTSLIIRYYAIAGATGAQGGIRTHNGQ